MLLLLQPKGKNCHVKRFTESDGTECGERVQTNLKKKIESMSRPEKEPMPEPKEPVTEQEQKPKSKRTAPNGITGAAAAKRPSRIAVLFGSALDRLYAVLAGKKSLLIFLACWSAILNYFLESSLRKSMLLGFLHMFSQPLVFLYNTLIIFGFFSVILLLKRRLFYFTVVSVFWLTIAITDYVVLLSRNTPLNAPDFRIIKSAFGVVKIYLNLFEQILVVLLILFAITLLVFSYVKGKRSARDMSFSLPSFAVIVSLTLAVTLFYVGGVNSSHFSDLPNAYKEYGFSFSFLCSVLDRGIDKPDNYSDESLQTLKTQLEEEESETEKPENAESDAMTELSPDGAAQPSEQTPNILFLQLESFYDPTNVVGLTFNEDPIPIFHRLQADCMSGKLTVPSIGAGTANTEFEVITGMDIDYFGIAEYPYLSILQDNTCESVAYDLKEYGYATHAMHNHTGSFYDRHIVFPNLGFDTFTSIENMRNIRRNERGWAKDAMLVDELSGVLASTPGQADLVYAISVQGHGKYPVTEEEFNELYGADNPAHIRVEGNEADPEKPGVDYWINQVHDMDAFLGSLIGTFAHFDEPTVIVMYGDHLPSFTLDNWQLKDGNLYQTRYVIWSNFDLGSGGNRDLYSFELSSYIMGMFGFESGYINRLHQKYFGTDADYSEELHLLQYDMLYGEKKILDGTGGYLPTNMRFGYRGITISDVNFIGNSIFVYGEGFNEYSRIYINGSKKQTTYINDGCVSAGSSGLHAGDRIKVVQVTTDMVEVGESNVYEISADQTGNTSQSNFSVSNLFGK